jgi:hypothetical protein
MNPAAAPAGPLSAGISPAELALMRHAAALISPAAAPGGADPFAALARPYRPAPPDPEGDFCAKPQGDGAHYYL